MKASLRRQTAPNRGDVIQDLLNHKVMVKKMDAIIDSSFDGLWISDREGRVVKRSAVKLADFLECNVVIHSSFIISGRKNIVKDGIDLHKRSAIDHLPAVIIPADFIAADRACTERVNITTLFGAGPAAIELNIHSC